MKKLLLVLMGLLALPAIIYAQWVNIDQIVYEVNGENAIVTYGKQATGDIVILPEVEIEGKNYPVTAIANSAFGAYVSGRREYIVTITSVVIPASIVSIGEAAFYKSTLTEIEIPPTVKSVGDRAFAECTDLKKAVVEGGQDNMGVEVFYECTALESVVIGEGHTVIPEKTFSDCKALCDVVLPSTLKEIRGSMELGGAFIYCSSLQSIALPKGLTSIGAFGFRATGLNSIDLPESLTFIGENAFNGCYSLKTVKLPSALEVLSKAAFRHCRALESVEIPDGVTVIEGGEYNEGCFDHCASLKIVSLGANVKEIKGYAFNACSIDSIVLPANVSEIGYRAFCPVKDVALKYVKSFAKEPPVLGESVFFEETMPSGMEVFVPESSIGLYRNADVWKDFFLTGFDDATSGFPTAISTTDHWTVYDIDGRFVLATDDYGRVSSLAPGLYMVNGRKTLIR